MTQAVSIPIQDHDLLTGMRSFLTAIMEKSGIDAMLVPARLSVKNRIMPMLVSDPACLTEADPLSPAFPVNAAQQLTRLTRQPAGGRLAAVLRPCEVRAFNELVKLNQGRREDVLIISLDCPGALSNNDFRTFADGYDSLDAASRAFSATAFSSAPAGDLPEVTRACRACDHPICDGGDIGIELFGDDQATGPVARAHTESGQAALTGLDLSPPQAPAEGRKAAVQSILAARRKYRDGMFAEVAEATNTIPALSAYLADCVNCYNCRGACPVCYCTTCVFSTDTFRHEPFQYVQWARRKGEIKMPTDTLFFHLTRMAHMSCACVGCGQCTNACPNDIPLSDLFTYVARHTQGAFDYRAGLDINARPPMNGFEEEEYPEIVGL
ncbi:hypothetical protein DSCO28_27580 [Desulfosarcina ovata subsp. sediminis]|uniref:4Fe-4S ferredoxin-type domain-containing protein n=1 Tax=Desulfosarcina ovata subsp. sediminis TaxID=885957 RepID=A0A5K7ZJ77_9BACT|nr:4Fe-4S dicluster domain-containing protein [Desulfosarcina ovata]BBO82192.1 hypothetical protein DSCO28_27580 [Desulfosarcina ovata subsp. sediminis]